MVYSGRYPFIFQLEPSWRPQRAEPVPGDSAKHTHAPLAVISSYPENLRLSGHALTSRTIDCAARKLPPIAPVDKVQNRKTGPTPPSVGVESIRGEQLVMRARLDHLPDRYQVNQSANMAVEKRWVMMMPITCAQSRFPPQAQHEQSTALELQGHTHQGSIGF